MTGTQLAALIRYKTKTNSTTFKDADMLVLVNLKKDELASRIQRVRPEIFQVPANEDLVADQREYAFPADVMNNIVRLMVKFTSSGDKVLVTPVTRAHWKEALQESLIVRDYSNDEPAYFLRRQAIYILSGTIIPVTDGIELVFNSFPANLANLTGSTDLAVDPTTTTHGFPREFHELWARTVTIEYKDRNNIKLSSKERSFEIDLVKQIDDFSIPNLDEEVIGQLPRETKFTHDDGYNL